MKSQNESWYQCILIILLMYLSPAALGHTQTHEAGYRCGNVTGKAEVSSISGNYGCVECMHPHNCLFNNTCRLGTEGSTCEKCLQGTNDNRYYRVGNTCTSCPVVPWMAVSFGVYILLFLVAALYTGFTESVSTKMKLLCHFLQYVLLTIHIKIAWPDSLVQAVAVVNFSKFNSNILIPECLLPKWSSMSKHYLEWLTSLGISVATLVFGFFMDRSLKMVKNREKRSADTPATKHVGSHRQRTTLRRLVCMVIMVIYMPTALSCIRTYLCSDTIPKELVLDHSRNVFLLDNDMACDTFVYQTIHFFATLYLLVMVIIFPVLIIFFTLRQKKWQLLYSQWMLYSPVYESYKDRYCFWEAVPLLRKFASIVLTECYPFSPLLQVAAQLGMSGLYTVLVILFRPYRACYWAHRYINVHIIFEVLSNMVVCILQGIGLSIVLQKYQPFYEVVWIGCLCIVLAAWIIMVLALSCETTDVIPINEITLQESQEDSGEKEIKKISKRGLKFWKPNKIGPDPAYVQKVKNNQLHIDF